MRRAAALLALLLTASPLLALDPLPDVQQGPGYVTWTLEADRPLVKLEDVMERLRRGDERRYLEGLQQLGIKQELAGRELAWPALVQPIQAQAQFLSFERRKLAVLTAPIEGRHKWYAVILRQEGNSEAYWRARQVVVFDTDPIEGYRDAFPDILGDDIRFWQVEHVMQDDIYGRARVTTIFKWDERGRMRRTFQEMADTWRAGKFIGEAQRLKQELVFKGDQRIVRKVTVKTFPWMKREEWERYSGVKPPEAAPSKVIHLTESFSWDPADFDFYGAEQELTKLVKDKSPLIRRDAARRLGEHLKTAHPQLVAALQKDKDDKVRMQVALALAAIGDPSALPAVDAALANVEEPDHVREALQKAKDALTAAPSAGSGQAAAAPAQ
jgi:hypothetical protein